MSTTPFIYDGTWVCSENGCNFTNGRLTRVCMNCGVNKCANCGVSSSLIQVSSPTNKLSVSQANQRDIDAIKKMENTINQQVKSGPVHQPQPQPQPQLRPQLRPQLIPVAEQVWKPVTIDSIKVSLKENDYITHVKRCIENAERNVSKLPSEILNMGGNCGKKNKHFYNNLLSMEGARYLDIGTREGPSVVSAMYGNKAEITVLDNWSQMDNGSEHKKTYDSLCEKYKGRNNLVTIDKDYFKIRVTTELKKFNIYLYDGDSSNVSIYRSVQHFYRSLDDKFIFVVDDWNWQNIETTIRNVIKTLHLNILFEKEILTPNRENGHVDGWWNGMWVAVLEKTLNTSETNVAAAPASAPVAAPAASVPLAEPVPIAPAPLQLPLPNPQPVAPAPLPLPLSIESSIDITQKDGLIEHVKRSIEMADDNKSKLTDTLLMGMKSYCGNKNKHLYNNLLNTNGIRYLDIGAYNGVSVASAMFENNADVTVIDNWTECGNDWRGSEYKNLKDYYVHNSNFYKGLNKLTTIDKNVFKVRPSTELPNKFNVYLYEGHITNMTVFRSLQYFYKCMDNVFVYMIHDWNFPDVKGIVQNCIKSFKLNILYEKEIYTSRDTFTDPSRGLYDSDGWWNGLYIVVLEKTV